MRFVQLRCDGLTTRDSILSDSPSLVHVVAQQPRAGVAYHSAPLGHRRHQRSAQHVQEHTQQPAGFPHAHTTPARDATLRCRTVAMDEADPQRARLAVRRHWRGAWPRVEVHRQRGTAIAAATRTGDRT
jgi:hypothetical protein